MVAVVVGCHCRVQGYVIEQNLVDALEKSTVDELGELGGDAIWQSSEEEDANPIWT